MSESLLFKKKWYQIPERMVKDVEHFLEWMEKHACTDGEVRQLYIDFGLYTPETKENSK